MAMNHKSNQGGTLRPLAHIGAGRFEKNIKGVTSLFDSMGMVLLVVLMFLGTADVIGRYLFNKPIIGTLEVSQVLLGSIAMLGLAGTQVVKGHVNVDFLLRQFPHRARAMVSFSTTCIASIVFALISWRALIIARVYHEAPRLIYTINWPLAPFQLLVSLGAAMLCLVLIIDLINYIAEMKGGT